MFAFGGRVLARHERIGPFVPVLNTCPAMPPRLLVLTRARMTALAFADGLRAVCRRYRGVVGRGVMDGGRF
jgi:hypothetical protein